MSEKSKEVEATQDEYFLDSPLLRAFIDKVRGALAEYTVVDEEKGTLIDVRPALDALQPHFAELLADQSWLPDEYAVPYEASGMGGGIGSWLLFRAGDRSLSLFSLVVPAGSQTPIHDHLAWGFVGLYRGEQEETVYRREDSDREDSGRENGGHENGGHWHNESAHEHHYHNAPGHQHDHAHTVVNEEPAVLSVTEVNHLKPGDFYQLIPPYGDIHAVKTLSLEPSVSIHLLANDTGCVIRHAFDLEHSVARSFRSGYSNVPCEVDEANEEA